MLDRNIGAELRHDVREHLRPLRREVTQSPDDAACDNLYQLYQLSALRVTMNGLTVDAIAAGTFAMIDMTGLRFRSMNICSMK